MVIGILSEYNPFHNGHLKQINFIKENYPDATIISIMSSDLVIRGDLSIISKFDRADLALDAGVDLVFSMNPEASINSAIHFAKQGVKHLNNLGVTHICFGSESGSESEIRNISELLINNEENIDIAMKTDRISYAQAVSNLAGVELKPNDILGVSYIKEIIKNGLDMKPIVLKRDHDSNIQSATKTRKLIRDGGDFKHLVPNWKSSFELRDFNDFSEIMKFSIINNNSDNEVENVINYLKNNIDKISDFDSIDSLSTKNYTSSKLRRSVIKCIFGIDNSGPEYIRLLGFNSKGSSLLKEIDDDVYESKFQKWMTSEKKVSEIVNLKYSGTLDREIKNVVTNKK